MELLGAIVMKTLDIKNEVIQDLMKLSGHVSMKWMVWLASGVPINITFSCLLQ